MMLYLLINGLAFGSIYALLALAMSITYKSTDIANFAQGELAMFSTYIFFSGLLLWPQGFWLLLILMLAFNFFGGFLLQKGIPTSSSKVSMIITLGLQMLLLGCAGWLWGPEPRHLPLPFEAGSVWFEEEGLALSSYHLWNLLSAGLLLGGLFLLMRNTSLGLAIQATQQHPESAASLGLNTQRIKAIAFGLSALTGGLAGMLAAPLTPLEPTMMWNNLLMGFAAAVWGGFRSLKGAVLAGYCLGMLKNLLAYYLSPDLDAMLAFGLIALVLLWRPQGIWGAKQVRNL
ncbi:MAG: branched-chain amino acid ABC transporter permease [Bacteroidota bacterium]